jgi:hypothetical protein
VRTLEFADLSPYVGELSGDDDEWLAEVTRIDPRDYRIGIEDDRPEDDEWLPLVERGRDGWWWAGRFIGSMTVGGRRLTVRPRLGIEAVEAWLDQAFGLVAPPVCCCRFQPSSIASNTADAGSRCTTPSASVRCAAPGRSAARPAPTPAPFRHRYIRCIIVAVTPGGRKRFGQVC